MGGNVEEWMLDGFDEKNPKAYRVFRGGYWFSTASGCAVVNRHSRTPTYSNTGYGFRVAASSVR